MFSSNLVILSISAWRLRGVDGGRYGEWGECGDRDSDGRRGDMYSDDVDDTGVVIEQDADRLTGDAGTRKWSFSSVRSLSLTRVSTTSMWCPKWCECPLGCCVTEEDGEARDDRRASGGVAGGEKDGGFPACGCGCSLASSLPLSRSSYRNSICGGGLPSS